MLQIKPVYLKKKIFEIARSHLRRLRKFMKRHSKLLRKTDITSFWQKSSKLIHRLETFFKSKLTVIIFRLFPRIRIKKWMMSWMRKNVRRRRLKRQSNLKTRTKVNLSIPMFRTSMDSILHSTTNLRVDLACTLSCSSLHFLYSLNTKVK